MANIIKKYKSYAKINLFLHVLNKRDDGYHNLQTWFQFVDLADGLTFSFNNSKNIKITSNIEITEVENNLVYKAILSFIQKYDLQDVGVDVHIEKNIPMGAGLGGGSSNAATTLKAMRDYYKPQIDNDELIPLGASLGADVPIFLYGQAAWAEGIGDIFSSKPYIEQYALLVKPNVHISTQEFFKSSNLEKHQYKVDKKLSLDRNIMVNDFERVFFIKYPELKEVFNKIGARFYMTGTGSCFFTLSDNYEQLREILSKIDKGLDKMIVKTLNYVY